jgi:hypothetical protein
MVKFIKSFVAAVLTPLVFSSCATIFSGTKQKITVTGNLETPVELLVDGVAYSNVTFPAKVKIKRKNEASKIVAFAPGYNAERQELEKTFNPVALISVVTFINPISMYVDWTTGTHKKAVQNKVALDFSPATSTQEVYDSYIDFGTEYYNADLLNHALFYFQEAYQIDTLNAIALQKIDESYARMDYLEKQARKKAARTEMWLNIMQATGTALQATADVMSTVQATKSSGDYSGSDSQSNSGRSGKATSGKNAQSTLSHSAISAYTKAYSEHENQLIKMSNGTLPCNNVRDIQNKMRSVRSKLKQGGYDQVQSSWETWSGC